VPIGRWTIPLWRRHCNRLAPAAARLRVPLDLAAIEADVALLGRVHRQGVIKNRRHGGRWTVRMHRKMRRTESSQYGRNRRHSAQRSVRLCGSVRCDSRCKPALARLKHLNRVEQVLARSEWSDPDVVEGLMCDLEGRLVEATAMNVFVAIDGAVVTPRVDRCGVAGVMRDLLIDERLGSMRRSWCATST
jgi:4-amino-4-deoxychorismate lyase